MNQIEKILSRNDSGETGTHQAGWLVPKERRILDFFPNLDASVYNPRCIVDAIDEGGVEWSFNFIYYNSRLFGGTRNEYRLTGVTEFLRRYRLKAGDTVIFSKSELRRVTISIRRHEVPRVEVNGRKVLRLSGNWIVVGGG